MSDQYKVVESRVKEDGSTTHLVSGPGGIIEVQEDGAGGLAGCMPTGYLLGIESEGDVMLAAAMAVKALSQEGSRFTAFEGE